MKYAKKIILGISLLVISSCRNNNESKIKNVSVENKLNDSEIYFASKRINESFSKKDSSTIEFISKFLERDSIKVIISHSIEENLETIYLSKNEKLDFFYNPENYSKHKTRRISEYYDVKGNCYEFSNEGISHNSIYIEKLCFLNDTKGLSLSEIYLLDGD
ncbi:hypothetical protein ACIGCP_17530 [Cellulophaga baltica]|jgi:hypothetical protein|uniref:hypothetical protein n=1 Tax=Cellulophaga baltica TaxID=76594 RepID=UPI0037C7F631